MPGLTGDARAAPAASFRLVLRRVSAMLFAQTERTQRLIPHPPIARTAFVVVLGASIAPLPWRTASDDPRWLGIDAAADRGRPVSATAVAASMGLPLTTVRRQSAMLVAAGLLVRTRAGFLVDPAFVAGGPFRETIAADAGQFLVTVRALAADGYAPAAGALEAGIERLPTTILSRVLVAFSLRMMESAVDRHGDFVHWHIHAAISVANVEHITRDPVLARRFAGEDQPPPDDLRRPIAARRLAERLGLPFETVRRRLGTLVAQGEVDTRPGGVIIPTRVLVSTEHMTVVRVLVHEFARTLHTLSSLAQAAERAGSSTRMDGG